MVVTSAGNIKEYKFYPAVMRWRARLTYTQVCGTGLKKAAIIRTKPKSSLYINCFSLQENVNSAVPSNLKHETQMLFDDGGEIKRIVPVVRNDAHKLIEGACWQPMCARRNFSEKQTRRYSATTLGPRRKARHPTRAARPAGLHWAAATSQPKEYATLAENRQPTDRGLLQVVLLRSMQQAAYKPSDEEPYSAWLQAYAHFTSPIPAAIPIFTVHRAIKAVLNSERSRRNLGRRWGELLV